MKRQRTAKTAEETITGHMDILRSMVMSKKGSGKVKYIADHYAYTCDCGSVHFNLLKSGKVECSGCGDEKRIEWRVR